VGEGWIIWNETKEEIAVKKSLIAVLLILFLFSACNAQTQPTETSITCAEATTTIVEITTKIEWPTFLPDEIVLNPDTGGYLSDSTEYIAKYRMAYYGTPWWVPSDSTKTIEILNILNERHYGTERFVETDEMDTVAYVKYCEIPREDFEAALEKHKVDWLTSDHGGEIIFDDEWYELPNPDIIYTFDNEIINAYYRRENPVVPEPGTYRTYESYEEYLRAN